MTGTAETAAAFGLLMALACVAAFVDYRRRNGTVERRIEEARTRAYTLVQEQGEQRGYGLAALVSGFGSAVLSSGVLPAKTRMELEQTLQAGGMSKANSLALFIGSKIVLSAGLTLLALMVFRNTTMRPVMHFTVIAGACVFGLMAPDFVIGRVRKSYLVAVEKGLADGLDLMVICAESGLALEATVRRVSVEVVHAHPRLARELVITSDELNLIADSRVALNNMGTRTGLVSLRRLAATLLQSIHYGTPLSSALRSLATELRQETLTRFEERAARLPVLLTIPMILFILPCVFLIVAGPVAVQVLKAMKH